jgi:hypothetical protein
MTPRALAGVQSDTTKSASRRSLVPRFGSAGIMASVGVACVHLTSPFTCAQEVKKVPAPAAAQRAGKELGPKVEVMPVEVFKGVPMNGEVNRANLIQQFTQQYRPLLRAELHFARSVCGLSQEQSKELTRAGEELLKSISTEYAELRMRQMQGITLKDSLPPTPEKFMRDGLAAALKTMVSPEVFARLQAELESRDTNRIQVAARNLVAKLDQDLFLTTHQRALICESLSSHWNEAWCPSLEMLAFRNGFIPSIPDERIVPFLSRSQTERWWATRPNREEVFFPVVFVDSMIVNNELMDEQESGGAQPDDPVPY